VAKKLGTLSEKQAKSNRSAGMAQVVEHGPSKSEALSSIPRTTKGKRSYWYSYILKKNCHEQSLSSLKFILLTDR
jgi:hypothetical protein